MMVLLDHYHYSVDISKHYYLHKLKSKHTYFLLNAIIFIYNNKSQHDDMGNVNCASFVAEQLKQLPNPHINDDRQCESKFKELELEYERNKQVLTARIKTVTICFITRWRTAPPTNDSSPPSSNSEKSSISSIGDIHRPTTISTPSSKNAHNVITKIGIVPPSILTHTQQTSSILELPLLPVPIVDKRNVIPTQSISNVS
ncbi:unnamed protein product [Rotaria sordida]|uniref:Uncharacterized protein n=2 Tax=Rotaria sordida TaxID=392033 RepID=A0A815D873_9BILA|nr:unnamed protein product [Rotaria sordida]CAF1566611.1 unnamed protein product [Rotaria sordida]